MNTLYARAPHQGVGAPPGSGAHAALLIDFDNVTMGMRSDLSKDLKKLLQSDIIKGKVTVQRAYADWRRYPQYIVPLSEASIDLIFAPAYGSNKKNATDIRMAIDGMELVFTRPEIGTFILLTGDSDFSSLVLKLKEYGKYVIGVGIQESSSDILVQNCDEYYSYTSLTGLRKTADSERSAVDPWSLVEKAINRMAERDDVMRSDRLKQVMIEMDPNFDEGDFGYSKFSRFLSEAAAKGLVRLTKLENGQHEVGPAGGGRGDGRRRADEARAPRGDRDRDARGRRGRDRAGRAERGERSDRGERSEAERGEAADPKDSERDEAPRATPRAEERSTPPQASREEEPRPLSAAYDLVRRALESLREMGRESTRDSDLKRKMLELDAAFDETALGFGKFSRFLRQAHDHEIVNLQKQDGGNYEVSLVGVRTSAPEAGGGTSAERESAAPTPGEPLTAAESAPAQATEAARGASRRSGLGPRRGSGRREQGAPPSLFDGQVASRTVDGESAAPTSPSVVPASAARSGAAPDLADLGLPSEPEEQIRFLTGYRGVGRKTAETLVEKFGAKLFEVLHGEPERLASVMPAGRAEQVLAAWRADFERRTAAPPVEPSRESVAAHVPPHPAEAASASQENDGGNAPEDGGNGPNGTGDSRRHRGSGRRRSRRGGRRGGRDQGS